MDDMVLTSTADITTISSSVTTEIIPIAEALPPLPNLLLSLPCTVGRFALLFQLLLSGFKSASRDARDALVLTRITAFQAACG